LSSTREKEAIFEEFYANFPEKFDIDWEVYSKQEWLATSLRCDVIYKSKVDDTLHLVEFKRHHADYPNISQVMEYYAKLLPKGVQIDQIYIAAEHFSDELLSAMTYCNITPLILDIQDVREVKKHSDEHVEGVYQVPLLEIKSIDGKLPIIEHFIPHSEFLYEQYKKHFEETPQTHFIEIWEYKVMRASDHYYILSIKHDGDVYHFSNRLKFMAGKSKQLSESTRNYAWDFYKKYCLSEPYKNIIIRSYEPSRAAGKRQDVIKKIEVFLNEDVNPKLHL
jgi:hypothetical protein